MSKENKDLRERIESVEKDARIRMLQRSVGQSHSRDSAIDTDLQVALSTVLSSLIGKLAVLDQKVQSQGKRLMVLKLIGILIL